MDAGILPAGASSQIQRLDVSGDVAGEHKVIFAGLGERLELGHVATTRQVFAKGAVRAVQWTRGRKPGLYSMRDVLGMK